MDDQIRNVLENAILAPSGDNCQPWIFRVEKRTLDLFNDPHLDTSLYNIGQRASLIAHGAALENIAIAAQAEGLNAEISLLPDPDNPDHIARIFLNDGLEEKSPLFKAIPLRHTNRERYKSVNISDKQVEAWENMIPRDQGKIWIGHDSEQKEILTDLLSLNDRLVFEVPDLHRFLFEQIRWNDNEVRQTGDGLDIKTLGLNIMDRLSFKFLRHFPLVSFLNHVGFSRIVQMKSKHTLRSASAFAVVSVPGSSQVDYIKGGRIWQRFLLQLALNDLTAQPLAGLACLMQSEKDGLLKKALTAKQKERLRHVRNVLSEMADVPHDHAIVGIFRIGQGEEVVRSLRRPLDTFLLE